MSRTIRRKNTNCTSSWSRWDEELVRVEGSYNYEWVPIDKEKEPKKWKKAWHKFHAESSHANRHSPGHYYRSFREREHRTNTKTELAKWFRDPTHVVIINDNPKSCQWDWR